MLKICLVIDLDDTLYDAEAAYSYALKSVGIDPLSVDFSQARQTIKARLGEGHVGARNRILYFKQFLEGQALYSHSAVLELMEKYEKFLADHIENQWALLGRQKLFEKRLSQVPKVILTNENLRTQMIKLSAIDPKGTLFPQVITSEEMGVEKPNLKLFERALEILKCDPKNCFMVGDNWDTDLVPALEMGMKGVCSTEFRKLKSDVKIPDSVKVISRLDELESVFS